MKSSSQVFKAVEQNNCISPQVSYIQPFNLSFSPTQYSPNLIIDTG